MKKSNQQTDNNALVEYQATHDACLHYDNFTWQVGSVLIAGTFVFWGFLIGGNFNNITVVESACLFITIVMSIWILYAQYNREIMVLKLERIWELEWLLHMQQHRRFQTCKFKPDKDVNRTYKEPLLKGRHLDYAIYVISSIGGPSIILSRTRLDTWLFPIIPFLIISVLIFVIFKNRKVDKQIQERRKSWQEEKGHDGQNRLE